MGGSAPIASITISYLRERYSEGINAVIHGTRKEQTMSRYIDADELKASYIVTSTTTNSLCHLYVSIEDINNAPSIDIVRCQDCKKSHIDGKTTHYLWCCEWGRSTDVFGYCERGEREAKECHAI